MRPVSAPRPAALVGALALACGLVLAGCSESTGPAGDVTMVELQQLEERVVALDDRLGALEEKGAVAGEDEAAAEEPDVIGQEVSVSAEVSEVLTTSEAGSAFRIGGESGRRVTVLSGAAPEGLDANDVVRITGTVQRILRDSFEADFGVAEDELFDDPEGFFSEFGGVLAVAASDIEVLQGEAG